MRWSYCALAALLVGCGEVKMPGPAVCDAAPGDVCTCPRGHVGDGTTCVDVVGRLHRARAEAACIQDQNDACVPELSAPVTFTAGGEPGAAYQVTVRVRGVVEQKTYTEGARNGYWQVGGVPDATGYNVYRLRVGDADYYLNAGESEQRRTWLIDYTQNVQVQAGDQVSLATEHSDNAIIKNHDDQGTPIVVPGVPPAPDSFNGQFVQIDVERVEPLP
jgi:hypothetical protein